MDKLDILKMHLNTDDSVKIISKNEVIFLQFELLNQTKMVRHLFSTREGGVSEGIYSSMNLSYSRGDNRECVKENFRRIASCLNCSPEDMIASDQTHTTNVRRVDSKDRGHGITNDKYFFDTDGLVTNDPEVVLATFYADCVPLYFVDPVNKAIGLSHSGWKGTAMGMGKATVDKMKECFGSNPEDILAVIGPSICGKCYEVSEDVADEFAGTFWDKFGQVYVEKYCTEQKDIAQSLLEKKADGKYQLNLQNANLCVLLSAGLLREHIQVANVCTCCNKEYLFSHRGLNGKRGNLGAFLGLR